MIELFKHFTVDQIILYTIMLMFAIKGCLDFMDWVKTQYKKKFDKDYDQKEKEKEFKTFYDTCNNKDQELMNMYQNLEGKIDNLTTISNARMEILEDKIDQLTTSNMHSIKSWIVEKHHILTKKGWVDDFTMDSLEKRYTDYVNEKGNSYIGDLMDEIRELPHSPKDVENED